MSMFVCCNSNSKDELRTKNLSENIPINGQELTLDFSNQGLGNIIMQQPPNFHQQQNNIQLVDLNTLQNYTNGMTELQQTNIDMTSNNHLENIVIESEDIGLEEEIVEMNERYEITEDQKIKCQFLTIDRNVFGQIFCS
jgi:hypothetical protein